MKNGILLFALWLNVHAASAAETPSGIPLDAEWKRKVYEFAVANLKHPSWGLAHAERDYQTTAELADAEEIPLERDALFAAAFLHDLGGMDAFAKKGVDHAVRSVELAEPLLRDFGFPMDLWPRVSDLILGHVYYGPSPASPQARAFRDADILDFLGAMGIARIFAITQEGRAPGTLTGPYGILKRFRAELPGKLDLPESVVRAKSRVAEIDAFFEALDRQSLQGKAL